MCLIHYVNLDAVMHIFAPVSCAVTGSFYDKLIFHT